MGAAIKIVVAASTIAAAQRMTFKDFEAKFEKYYGFGVERGNRERIFNENLKYMEELNSDESNSIQLDVGPFADRSLDEFNEYVNLGLRPPGDESQMYGMPHLGTITGDEHVAAPESIDWVEKGAVTPVKNQGGCGSCWSYSATGALEGGFFLETSFLVELSQQFLLDCDTENSRCRGGWMNTAYKYVRDHGICTEYSYPYHCKSSSSSECERSSCRKGVRDCRVAIPPKALAGYVTVQKRSTRALEIAVMRGPVSVAVNAGTRVFQHYSRGVVTDPYCGAQLNHAVLAVGFGVEGRVKYWLVKNSWGEHWGADGYIKIGRGVSAERGGECGILLASSFPVLGFGHSVPNLQPPESHYGKPGPESHYGKPGPESHYGKPGPESYGYGKPGPESHYGYDKHKEPPHMRDPFF